jgi:hydroxymethylglutaryl-CoA lyase
MTIAAETPTPTAEPAPARIRDVTLRDGLQLTGKPLPTERKVRLVRELLALGVEELEIGSMARPDLVPAVADTLDVVAALTTEELERCWIWVATPRHVERARAAGATRFQYCFSASDSHNRANIGRDTEASLAAMPDAMAAAGDDGQVQLCIATSFTCPFEGVVPIERVAAIVDDPRTDGALGGLGGCPFAPGASGNTATEDLAFGLRPGWATPESFAELVRLGQELTSTLDEADRARVLGGALSEQARAFPWTLR